MSEDEETTEPGNAGDLPAAPLAPPPPPPPPATPTVAVFPPAAVWPDIATPASHLVLTPPSEPLPILTILPERAKQRRWTVLLRAFLAIPLAVVVLLVGIATLVCVVLGWFFALVMGRAPEFVRSIVTDLLRLSLRLEAYLFFLTDRFPPFSLQEVPDFGTSLAVPPATKLHRAAVLFRGILLIPASIAVRVTGLGLQIIAIFMWFVVLITGWLPKPVHEAFQALIRYEARVFGYFYLLVPTYPGELFGDLAPTPPIVLPSRAVGAPTDAVPAFASLPPLSPPASTPPPPKDPWMLILGMGAKRLMIGAVVLGVVALIGLGILNASVQNHANLVQVNNQLVSNLNQFDASVSKCQTLACLEQANATLSQQLGSFVNAVESSSHAGVSQSTIDRMTAAAENTEHATADLSGAPSLRDYRAMAAKLGIDQSFAELLSAQHQFVQQVNAARFG